MISCAAVSPAIVRGASGLTENSAEMVFSLFECFDNDPGAGASKIMCRIISAIDCPPQLNQLE